MYFNIKRYYYGVVKRKLLMLLVLIIPTVYVIVSAVLPDRFSVVQHVTISEDSPIALMTDPVGYMPFKDFVNNSSAFFMNSYALNKLAGTLLAGWAEKYGPVMEDVIKTTMSMDMYGKNKVQIRYFGKSREVGEILVMFYSERLVNKAVEGLVRSNNEGPDLKPDLTGGVEVYELRAFWRNERLLPFIYCSVASLILVLILFGFLEWNDPSFKSERQIARYIGLPILGNIPDLNKVAMLIQSEKENTA